MECGGSTPLCYGEARLASEEQRLLLLRVFSCSWAILGMSKEPTHLIEILLVGRSFSFDIQSMEDLGFSP